MFAVRSRYCRDCGAERVRQRKPGGIVYFACPECTGDDGGAR
ncbi:MAG: hypothetical protein ABEJ79_07845 [Halolamina sp.]